MLTKKLMGKLLYLSLSLIIILSSCSQPRGILPREGGEWRLEAHVEELRMGGGRIDLLRWQDYIDRYYAGGFLNRDEWTDFQSSFSFMGWELRHLASQVTPPEDRSQWVWQSLDEDSDASFIFSPDGEGAFIGRDDLNRAFSWQYDSKTERITLTWAGLQGLPVSLSFVVLSSAHDKQIWQADHEAVIPNPFTAAESETLFTVRWQLVR